MAHHATDVLKAVAVGGLVLGCAAVDAQAAKPAVVATGSYECWAHGQARMLLNFKVTGKDTYAGESSKGSFTYDSASGKVTFKGGHLDGMMPKGFTTIYHEPHGKPTVSFRGPSGGEASFCERARK